MYITASDLYNYMKCPHRVWRDKHGPQDEKITKDNPFVELLWQKGVIHERSIIQKIGDFVDISAGTMEERFEKTVLEMKKRTGLIYQGVIKYDNLLGIPDLLKILPNGEYIPIDIKSGQGLEGSDEYEDGGKLKKHYAAQLCLYVEVLKQLGFSKSNQGAIIDISGSEVDYILDEPQGKRNLSSWWDLYEEIKREVELLLENRQQNKPALSSICALCHWYTSCKNWCIESGDLTNIFNLGRSKRDVINQDLKIENLEHFNKINVGDVLFQKQQDKAFLKGIAEATLKKLVSRSEILLHAKKPVIYKKIHFPQVSVELFFDIENDPTQGLVYLHGVYEKRAENERFLYFLAKENTVEAEKKAWGEFWEYIKSLPVDDYAVYYFSHHEKTTYKKMSEQYPDIISQEEVKKFFDNPNVIDLYSDIVFKYTDWPLSSYSLKELAAYLKFKWRDETPSGALSIQWYNEYLETKNEAQLRRIIDYNEDDCKALMILKNGIEELVKNLE